MNKNEISELRLQLQLSIVAIQEKIKISEEKIIPTYLDKYNKALIALDSGNENEIMRCLNLIENCFRGYMETSSIYEQEFLKEMSKMETLINNLSGHP
tara:strand:- start:89 stop:382 length:294 start_codon:yes stop_codon:yes gene_type:complete